MLLGRSGCGGADSSQAARGDTWDQPWVESGRAELFGARSTYTINLERAHDFSTFHDGRGGSVDLCVVRQVESGGVRRLVEEFSMHSTPLGRSRVPCEMSEKSVGVARRGAPAVKLERNTVQLV